MKIKNLTLVFALCLIALGIYSCKKMGERDASLEKETIQSYQNVVKLAGENFARTANKFDQASLKIAS